MNKFAHLCRLVRYLFDEERTVQKATRIIEGVLRARTPRLSEIANEGWGGWQLQMYSTFAGGHCVDESLLRLFQENAAFVIGDPIEICRPQVRDEAEGLLFPLASFQTS